MMRSMTFLRQKKACLQGSGKYPGRAMTKISNRPDGSQDYAAGSGGTFVKPRRPAPKLSGGLLLHFLASPT